MSSQHNHLNYITKGIEMNRKTKNLLICYSNWRNNGMKFKYGVASIEDKNDVIPVHDFKEAKELIKRIKKKEGKKYIIIRKPVWR